MTHYHIDHDLAAHSRELCQDSQRLFRESHLGLRHLETLLADLRRQLLVLVTLERSVQLLLSPPAAAPSAGRPRPAPGHDTAS
ncbi:hypothetical protein [Deinococcus hohokamensis]|uniref:Uncharacterized protein n=1 Tax=Deinococcus hohokamensis TaxID=309883 RepID=A0ABV9I6T4_9DEIO